MKAPRFWRIGRIHLWRLKRRPLAEKERWFESLANSGNLVSFSPMIVMAIFSLTCNEPAYESKKTFLLGMATGIFALTMIGLAGVAVCQEIAHRRGLLTTSTGT